MKFCFVADDFGECSKTNEATICLFRGGVVRSATVLAAEECVYPRLPAIQDRNITWGAHMYLTDRKPLTDHMKQFFASKKGISKKDIFFGLLSRRISADNIFEEFDAQFSRLLEHGFSPRFIDTHQNLHGLPLIFDAAKRVANKHGLKDAIRPFAQLNFDLKDNFRTLLSRSYANLVSFKPDLRVLVGCPGYRMDCVQIDDALDAWDRFLFNLKERFYRGILVPCHAGVSPGEVTLYTSPEFSGLMSRYRVELVSVL